MARIWRVAQGWLVSFCVACSASAATAVDFLYVQDDRSVEVDTVGCVDMGGFYDCNAHPPSIETPSPAFSPFSAGDYDIRQSSSLAPTEMVDSEEQVHGRSWWPGGYTDWDGTTTFDISFEVDEPVGFALEYDIPDFLTSVGIQNGAQIILQGGSTSLSLDRNSKYPDNGPPTFPTIATGVFQPGIEYRLWTTGQYKELDFTLTIAPVPEPGTGLLLGFGLAWLAARRHRA